jgi:large subunit ribosomal protein L6
MSRIGKLPIAFSKEVSVVAAGGLVKVSGPKGSLEHIVHKDVTLDIDDKQIRVMSVLNTKIAQAMLGTTRSIINNMVLGVKVGFKIELEIVGVGYRVNVKDQFLNLAVGKSHSVKLVIPKGISITLPKSNHIVIEGIDKQQVGQFAAILMKQRPTEPFKGKGIKLKDQVIKKKKGKRTS